MTLTNFQAALSAAALLAAGGIASHFLIPPGASEKGVTTPATTAAGASTGTAAAAGTPAKKPAPAASGTPLDWAAASRLMATGVPGFTDLQTTLAMVGALKPEEFPAVLDQLSRNPKGAGRDQLNFLLLSRWAGLEPAKAAAYAFENAAQGREMGTALQAVFPQWLAQDQPAALAWWREHKTALFRGQNMEAMLPQFIMQSLAALGPDAAAAFFQELEPGAQRQQAVKALLTSAVDGQARNAFLAKLESVADEADKPNLQRQLAMNLAVADLPAARSWIDKLPSAEERSELALTMTPMVLAAADPDKGADWLMKSATPDKAMGMMMKIVSTWMAKNSTAAGDWLKKQPESPDRDAAINTYARTLSQRDPSGALKWAMAVSDPVQREQLLTDNLNAFRLADRAAADQALQSLGLPEDVLKRLSTQPSP